MKPPVPLFALLLLAFVAGSLPHLPARPPQRPPLGIAFYDLDRLYDTLPARFYDDSDHTPGGQLGWTAERYRRRVEQAAAVVDSMALPVVALWGVENRAVVRDLASACHGDYAFLHETLNSLDGMDFALLYHGDRFMPLATRTARRSLVVEGLLDRDSVALVLSADPRTARWLAEEVRLERPRHRLVVAGAWEGDARTLGLRDAHAAAERAGHGNRYLRGGWRMQDRILVDTAYAPYPGRVYIRRFLVDPRTGTPVGVYTAGRYTGGHGRALPVFVRIE